MGLSERVQKFELDSSNYLLMNPMTGAIDIIPSQFLKEMPPEVETKLKDRGYFLSEEGRQENILRLREVGQEHSKNIPYWFYVLTTLNCNFGCPICYEKTTRANSELDPAILDNIIERISGFQHARGIAADRVNIILFGGEPLLLSNPEILRNALNASSEHGWKVVTVTNGSLIEQRLNIFKEHRETIADFRITIDGPKAIHNSRRPNRDGSGTFDDVVNSIDLLLENGFEVKMQTILGRGNINRFDGILGYIAGRGWLQNPKFQWRIEGSHDYANLDPQKDEISEGRMVQRLINAWDSHPELRGKLKFESFKYLGHIVRSFGWLGEYKTYWGPKLGFCEPQKGLHYVFSTDGKVYHCPRTINNPDFQLEGLEQASPKRSSIIERPGCIPCDINTICGGGCVVQKQYYSGLDCREYARSVITEFVGLMKDRILERAEPGKLVSVNDLW